MFNLVGKFKIIKLFLIIVLFSTKVFATEEDFKFDFSNWEDFYKQVEIQKEKDKKNGLSYIISGSLALIGGIWGNSISEDTAEKGIYTIFQTIGVASIGYGAFVWQIGGEERSLYQTLHFSKFTTEQKSQFLRSYNFQKKEREKKERLVKAVTHGLIAGLNFYNASQQKQDSLKSTLNFIGGVNLLAAISFTFEF